MGLMLPIVKKLLNLTSGDEIQWMRPLFNISRGESRGWIFYLELLQDAQPHLEIHSPDGRINSLYGYYNGIPELDLAITAQYKRRKLYEFSDEHKRNMAELENQRTQETQKNAEKIANLTKRFEEEHKNPRAR